MGSTTLTSAGGNDVFVARLNSAGAWTQAARAGSSGDDVGVSVAVDGSGNVAVVGFFYGPTTDFGFTTLTNANGNGDRSDAFVARLNSAGAWTQAVSIGGQNNDAVTALALDGGGNAVVGGDVASSPATFGTNTITSAGSGYAAKLMGLVTSNKSPRADAPFALAPNPAHDRVQLSWSEDKQAQQLLLLIDALGREVRQQQLPPHATQATLNLQDLSGGVYIVRIGSKMQRLLVE